MSIRLEPGDLDACDAAMRREQAVEDYVRAKAQLGAEMTDQEIEKEIQAKGLNAPRITPESIESCIAMECYTTGECFSVWRYDVSSVEEKKRLLDELELVTVCILVLRNGFKVIGESVCVSRENFDAELGRKIARQNAVGKIWALEGYLLKQRLIDRNETEL